MISFEWHEEKDRFNQKKHGVSFEEAKSVFYDEEARQFFDREHSIEEDRFLLLGMSQKNRLLMICHCERGENDVIRIISARKATRKESTFYPGEK